MSAPGLGSTYRVQVQALGLEKTRILVPYLAGLGIETLYLSPLLAAARGSSHGYDVIDPRRVDPALGTEADLEALFDELAAHGMRALLDIVPNHMAAVPENAWWWGVLRDGVDSECAPTFDIDWARHQGRVLVPVLPRPLAEVLAAGEFAVDGGRTRVELDGLAFPLAPGTAEGDPSTVLVRQHYRAAYWRAGATEGNYRRFFDINSLIGVRQEDPDVFEATHAYTAALARHPAVGGVRVDHVDGLADPAQYLRRLRGRLGGERTIVIEKILGHDESVDAGWPVDGTTGYEFADRVTALLVDAEGSRRLRTAGAGLCGWDDRTFAALTEEGKRQVLERSFSAEHGALARASIGLLDVEAPGHDLSELDVRRAWAELTVRLPVYRTYIDERGASEDDRALVEAAGRGWPAEPETRRAGVLLVRALCESARRGSPWLAVARRWQQLSGAVMAKGAEDTATYRYPGLLALADVGGDPDQRGDALDEFHRFAAARTGGLNATSTHDSKRNEDARALLAVLSEADAEWLALVRRWHAACTSKVVGLHPVHELALFQSLLCLWPTPGDEIDDTTLARISAQAVKGARESKLRTSWTEPDVHYEEALVACAGLVRRDDGWREDLAGFGRRIGPAALANALAMVLLKVCAPGVPDFYQGTEFGEPALTDPDNRRPVDFAVRAAALAGLPAPSAAAAGDLLARWPGGHIKMYVMRTLLRDRRSRADLYGHGSYEPVPASTRHAVAFRRHLEGHGGLVCVVPRLTFRLAGPAALPIGRQVWKDDTLIVSEGGRGRYREELTGRVIEATAGRVSLSEVFSVLPVAVLRESA
ncbi:MAG TPA: malto-oligosyltrehalose synthase [Acidimicrobiales bacterium]|nr:malto-oligosyltrehalose synthase [Acidimicrobiales bacterium]